MRSFRGNQGSPFNPEQDPPPIPPLDNATGAPDFLRNLLCKYGTKLKPSNQINTNYMVAVIPKRYEGN